MQTFKMLADRLREIASNLESAEPTLTTGELETVLSARRRTCQWTIDDINGYSTWETECGNMFQFDTGGPLNNGFLFCPYCAAKLIERYISEVEAAERAAKEETK